MASLAHLQGRLSRLRAALGREQENHLDECIGERIEEWTQESLFRKLEAFYLCNGDTAKYHERALAISEDIESRKTEEEKRAEQRYKLKYPCTGAAEALYQKLSLQLENEKKRGSSCAL